MNPQSYVNIIAGAVPVHAQGLVEETAIMVAQEALGTHDLGHQKLGVLEMATTSQPCIQCYGALIWSGIRRVLVGARGEDVETLVGFDEGPVPEDWVGQWALRGIETRVDVLRDEACEVLRAYKASGAPVYNSQANRKV